ncbi:MAG: RNA polymerase sigma factor [Cyclobacteriaceae bacterium]
MTFEEIHQQYSLKIFRLCMGYVNDHDHAQDLVQETFISIWQNLETFRHEASIGTWIFRIASNHCLRAIKREGRITKTALHNDIKEEKEEGGDEKIQFLYKCISELKETERIIISLVLEDLPQAEIASITGMTEGNVRVKVHRIKELLSNKFTEHGKF